MRVGISNALNIKNKSTKARRYMTSAFRHVCVSTSTFIVTHIHDLQQQGVF
jgi:hypothetical protein